MSAINCGRTLAAIRSFERTVDFHRGDIRRPVWKMSVVVGCTLVALWGGGVVSTANAALLDAHAISFAQDSPQGLDSVATIVDGVPTNVRNSLGGTANALVETGSVEALTSQVDGFAIASAEARANLATGTLKNFAFAGDTGRGARAIANSRWSETVTFNNLTTGTVALPFSWRVEGILSDTNGPELGGFSVSSSITLSVDPSSINRFPGFLDDNAATPGSLGAAAWVSNNVFLDVNFPQGLGNGEHAWGVTTLGDSGVQFDATILFQPGLTTLDIAAELNLDCGFGSTCNYGHTAAFRFGDLPNGLSWNSESGVFLSQANTPVPLPAGIWLFGSVLLGGVRFLRRHRQVV